MSSFSSNKMKQVGFQKYIGVHFKERTAQCFTVLKSTAIAQQHGKQHCYSTIVAHLQHCYFPCYCPFAVLFRTVKQQYSTVLSFVCNVLKLVRGCQDGEKVDFGAKKYLFPNHYTLHTKHISVFLVFEFILFQVAHLLNAI